MIDLVNYTCKECGEVCTPEIVDPHAVAIARPCGHQSGINMNLKGRMFGEGAIKHGMLKDDEIPAAHKEAFVKFAGERAVIDGGVAKWWVRDWVEYIDRFHAKTLQE